MLRAEEILETWEPRLFAKEMANDRFGCGGWPNTISPPSTPADYLAWIEDEADLQRVRAESEWETSEERKRLDYATKLETLAKDLREVGVLPSKLPWE